MRLGAATVGDYAGGMSRYGHFDDRRREYVITRPDTPLPWLNYIGQDELFGICTQTAGGYSFWKDARLRRLTRYRYNNVPLDSDGRVLYVKQGDVLWNPGWKPTRTPLDAFECRHGLGYTRITSRKAGIEVEQLVFVPPHENIEIWKVTVRNRSKRHQSLTLFSFVEYHPELGEISSYPPGYKENGSVFSHSNTWLQIGWCLLGEGERALDYYLSLCPSAKQDLAVYRSEPYVYPQMTAGFEAPTPGEAKNSWLTGTAAWSFVAASQYILGIRPDFDGLRVDPCIPKRWQGFTVRRKFRGVEYTIEVKNPQRLSRGIDSLLVDGKPVKGNLVPALPEDRNTVKVEATLGT